MPSHDLIESSNELPPRFDPRRFPIIAAHFYGLVPLPRQDDANELGIVDEGIAA